MTIATRRHFLGAALTCAASAITPRVFAAPAKDAPPAVLPRALAALDGHGGTALHRDRLALVDFARASTEPRFQLIDLTSGRVIASWLVAHGRGSDPANTGWLQHFSNRPGSNASAEGSYRTADTYRGKHGLSRRLTGLDSSNSLALQRGIVIHGADYVCESLARSQGRIGRSQGCFAVATGTIGEVLDRLGPDRLLFASK